MVKAREGKAERRNTYSWILSHITLRVHDSRRYELLNPDTTFFHMVLLFFSSAFPAFVSAFIARAIYFGKNHSLACMIYRTVVCSQIQKTG